MLGIKGKCSTDLLELELLTIVLESWVKNNLRLPIEKSILLDFVILSAYFVEDCLRKHKFCF